MVRNYRKKEFNDLIKLYKLLYHYFEENDETPYGFDSIPLFRCTDGKMYSKEDIVYILPEDDISEVILNSYHIIDKKSFGTINQRKNIKDLFVEYFEIEEFSEKSICEEMFRKYESDSEDKHPSVTDHIKDIKLLLKNYDDNKYDFQRKLRDLAFILTSDNEYTTIKKYTLTSVMAINTTC